jgi:hypothetical protein
MDFLPTLSAMPTRPLPEPPRPQPEAEPAPEPPVTEGAYGLGPGQTASDSPLAPPPLASYSGFLVPQISFQVQC